MKKWISSSSSHADSIEKIKDDSFGHSFFIQPEAPNSSSAFFVWRMMKPDWLARSSLSPKNFQDSKGVQSGGALIVFLENAPVTVK